MLSLPQTIGRTFTWRVFGALGCISQPICGFAPNVGVLIAARAFGGMTWAGCGPAGFAIMAEGLEPAKRGIVAAWQTMSGTFGGSMGTVAGGFVIAFMGWRYVFLFAMFPMAVVWLLSFCMLPEDHQVKTRGDLVAKLKSFDKLGTLLFINFSGCFLMGLNRGNDLGWQSATVLGFFAAALVTLPLLVFVERRALEPILPFSLILFGPNRDEVPVARCGEPDDPHWLVQYPPDLPSNGAWLVAVLIGNCAVLPSAGRLPHLCPVLSGLSKRSSHHRLRRWYVLSSMWDASTETTSMPEVKQKVVPSFETMARPSLCAPLPTTHFWFWPPRPCIRMVSSGVALQLLPSWLTA